MARLNSTSSIMTLQTMSIATLFNTSICYLVSNAVPATMQPSQIQTVAAFACQLPRRIIETKKEKKIDKERYIRGKKKIWGMQDTYSGC